MSPQESFKNILKKLDKSCKITFAGTLGIGFLHISLFYHEKGHKNICFVQFLIFKHALEHV